MKLCSICKKNPAVVFVSKSYGKQFINEGYCLSCAINSGITPVSQLAEQFSIDPEELKEMVENMSDMIASGDMHDAFADIFGGGNLMDPNDMEDDGDEAEAVALWERVLELDENNELANTGIGKAYLTAGDYEKALYYLELGMAREYYSIAFKRFRNQILIDNASWFLTGAAVLLVLWFGFKAWKKRKKGEDE